MIDERLVGEIGKNRFSVKHMEKLAYVLQKNTLENFCIYIS